METRVFCSNCKHYWNNGKVWCRTFSVCGYTSIVIQGKYGEEHREEIIAGKNACLKNFKFVKLPDEVTPIRLICNKYDGIGLEWCEDKNATNTCKDYRDKE